MRNRMWAKAKQSSLSAKRYASKRYFDYREKRYDFHKLNVCYTFPMFQPYSSGTYEQRAELTINCINQTIPSLGSLATSIECRPPIVVKMEDFPKTEDQLRSANELKRYFDRYGSDKATLHQYHYVYGPILMDRDRISGVLEVGLGTNNTDVVSNMGTEGRPGASLRAFRDYLEQARIYGADIDRRILFAEDRIETFFVDQTAPDSFVELGKQVPSGLDLIIDDGLHTPSANIETLKFALSRIKRGGWSVIEDIGSPSLPVWDLVSALLPHNFEAYLITADLGNLFAVRRLS
jgi:hypothetical protein